MSRLRFKAFGLLGSLALLVAGQVASNPPASAAPPQPGTGAVVPLTPARLLDTRSAAGGGQLAARETRNLVVTGQGGVPAAGAVAAVVLNVTALRSTAGGYVTAWAGGASRPGTASLNFSTGRPVGNLVLVPVSPTDGSVNLYNGSVGTVHLVVDVSGYIRSGEASDPGAVVPLPPARLLDTRSGQAGGQLASRAMLPLHVGGLGGVPRGAVAAVLNVTALRSTAGGYVTAWAGGKTRPGTASLNFATGQAVGNLVLAPLGADGTVNLYNGSTGTLHLVVDVSGYVRAGAASDPGAVVPLTPARLLDTRSGQGGAQLATRASLNLAVAGHGGVPATGVAAVVLNVTALRSTAGGYVTVWPGGTNRPGTAALNFSTGQAVGNLVLAPVGADGTINLYNGSTGTLHLVVDVSGYVLAAPPLAWGASTTIDRRYTGTTSISCPTTSFCAAVDQTGGAVTFDGTAWSGPTPVENASVVSVSCASASFCLAIDSSGRAVKYNGTNWSAPATVDAAALTSISCASATFCVGGDAEGHATTFDGSNWSTPVLIDPDTAVREMSCSSSSFCAATDWNGNAVTYSGGSWGAVVSVDAGPRVTSVSCASASFCVAVDGSGSAVTFNGSTWSAPTVVHSGLTLEAVSCAGVGSCVAVGDQSAVTLSGSTWSVPVKVDPSPAERLVSVSCAGAAACQALNDQGQSYSYDGAQWAVAVRAESQSTRTLHGVSCPTTTFCVAVDDLGAVMSYNGATWTNPRWVDNSTLLAISCPSISFCLAADGNGKVVRFDGSGWSAPVSTGQSGALAVSCASSSFCAAAASSGTVAVFNGASWSLPVHLGSGSSQQLTSVSCPSASFCVATSYGGNAFTYNGTNWSAAVPVDDPTKGLVSVSCPTNSFCAAVDAAGRAVVYNGQSWTAPVQIESGAEFNAVSCPSAGVCVAVDSAGREATFSGVTWSAPVTVSSTTVVGDVRGVDCATDTVCVAVDDNGMAYHSS